MLCTICLTKPATNSAIVEGVYYKNVCDSCKSQPNVSSGHARWEQTIDAEDHEADIMQPWNADGSINARFTKLYPKQAKHLFTPEEIRNSEIK